MRSISTYLFSLFFIVSSYHGVTLGIVNDPETLNVAILGLGGRSQVLLLECLKLRDQVHKEVCVVAVCDDHAGDSLDFFLNKLTQEKNPLLDDYKKMVDGASFYPDNSDGLKELFNNHKNLDRIWITSANDSHLRHINAALTHSSCKNLFLEKPLFKTLEEFTNFNVDTNEITINVGLTLRYATMAKIVAQKLQEYQCHMGTLKKVKSWERVRFGHALTAFMMCWRRYISLSGGSLLEKSIHDLDLALFFIKSLNIDPQEIFISSESSHNFFKQSRKDEIVAQLLNNEDLRKSAERWDTKQWQRILDFTKDEQGHIDWPATIDTVFKGLPQDDNFDKSDIIPDYYKVAAQINPSDKNSVDFELEVDFGGFRTKSERGIHFIFEYGNVLVDIMKSKMIITLDNGSISEFDLQTNNSDHADGDTYVAHTILDTLPAGQHKATFHDPIVKLSTLMGLIAEYQSLHNIKKTIQIKKTGNNWLYDLTTI